MAAKKKSTRKYPEPWAGKRKSKKPRQPSFKHGLIVEIAEGSIIGVRSTVPRMTVIILDHDAPDGFADFNIGGSICQRIIDKAKRTTRGVIRNYMGKGDPMPPADDQDDTDDAEERMEKIARRFTE